jgi:methyl-accepting chemotaxis protein
MKLVHKIILIAGISILGMAAIALSGYIGMEDTAHSLDRVYKDRVVPLRDIKRIADLYAVSITDLAHKARNRNIEYASARERVEKAEAEIDTLWRSYLSTQLVERERLLIADVEKLRAVSVGPINRLKDILRDGDGERLAEFTRVELYPAIEPLSDKFSELIELQLDVAKEEYEESVEGKDLADAINLVVIVLASFVSIALALFIARQVSRELGGEPNEVASRVAEIAAGDLSRRIAIGAGLEHSVLGSMEKMRGNLHDIITRIRTGAEQLERGSETMASDGDKVMSAVNVQSESTSAIAAAVEEMSVNVSHISNCAQDANRSSVESGNAVIHSIEVVRHSVEGMNGITATASATADDIKRLAEQSSEIGKIINVIKGIADQTNLLALNAAIEAARAGEAGRGFAVVADEVRKLAERTGASTAEIVSMVEAIQSGTAHALESMVSSQANVTEGTQLANDTGVSMEEVKHCIDATLELVKTITEALSEQDTAGQQIGRDIERIAQMSDGNVSTVNNLNATAAHIKELAAELNGLVKYFRL